MPKSNRRDQAQVILEQALKLSSAERAHVAKQLIVSLDEGSDVDVEQAWQEEVQRRLGQIERGEVKTIPWEEVQKRLRHGR